jgi:hypothetical protein
MIHLSTLLKHYKRPDIQQAMVDHARDKEVALRFNDSFGTRPGTLRYPADVLAAAQQGATSFHCSEELWRNPLQLSPQLKREELDRLRKGWDLILDIDCQHPEYSKIAAQIIIEVLSSHGISSIGLKFSGNKGFHIGVPFEAFPEKIGAMKTEFLFPEAARKIAFYIKETIKEELGRRIMMLEGNEFAAIANKTGKTEKELQIKEFRAYEAKKLYLNVESFLVIDTVLISSRHLYRMPYSLHEKSGLVSMPLLPENLPAFHRDDAKPESINAVIPFLNRSSAKANEARSLFIEAYDFTARRPIPETHEKREFELPEQAIPEQFFPLCIQKILAGMEDGRKRALFILVNFLSSCGWDAESIEKKVREWNGRNKEQMREVYFMSQLRYSRQQSRKMPPNCSNDAYYKDLGIKCGESICSRCHNPVNFAKMRARDAAHEAKKPRRKKTEGTQKNAAGRETEIEKQPQESTTAAGKKT